jgi:ABC-type polysaccharide/polyol phosphate transport system ATPase subunit
VALPTSPEGTIAATQIWKRFRADPTRQSFRAKAGHLKRVATGKGRRGWRWALRDVDFVVEPGESVGLVGINGSGNRRCSRSWPGSCTPTPGASTCRAG